MLIGKNIFEQNGHWDRSFIVAYSLNLSLSDAYFFYFYLIQHSLSSLTNQDIEKYFFTIIELKPEFFLWWKIPSFI